MGGGRKMTENTENGSGQGANRWRILGWGAAALLLLLPLVAMQFTDEVNWGVGDFVLFGAMLVTVGVAFELAVRMTTNFAYRFAFGLALLAAFLLFMVNGAVGIIGSEDNPANLMYGGVLAVGVIGAAISRFQPDGMAIAMVATALAQVLVAVIALVAELGSTGPIWPGDLLGATGIFVTLWLGSAWLFWKSAHEAIPSGAGAES